MKFKMPNLKGLAAVGKTFVIANRPELLLGTSITATIGAVVLAAKGGYEARGLVIEKQHPTIDLNKPDVELSSKEKIQLTWLCYTPAAVTTVAAVGATSALHLVHVKDKKMMATATMAAIEEVKNVSKEFEEEKASVLEANADPKTGVAKVVGSDGEVEELYLVRDERTGRDIWSNKNRIEAALVDLNNIIATAEEVELSYFYDFAGYASTPDAHQLGWTGVMPELVWGHGVRDDGRPVRTFKFRPEPEKDMGVSR